MDRAHHPVRGPQGRMTSWHLSRNLSDLWNKTVTWLQMTLVSPAEDHKVSSQLIIVRMSTFSCSKVDKIFASVLPIGRYPLSVSRISVIVRLSWLLSLLISVTVNLAYPCTYEPAAVLCIPLLPSAFFFTLSSLAGFIFICLIIGFSATLVFLKKVRDIVMMLLKLGLLSNPINGSFKY